MPGWKIPVNDVCPGCGLSVWMIEWEKKICMSCGTQVLRPDEEKERDVKLFADSLFLLGGMEAVEAFGKGETDGGETKNPAV